VPYIALIDGITMGGVSSDDFYSRLNVFLVFI